MKTDLQLKNDVSAELAWDPSIQASRVGVAVKDGIVTLSGHLDTYAEKHAIERLVQRVQGVRAVAVEIDVKLDPGHQRIDAEIAAAVETAFGWHALLPAPRIHVKVEKGWVSLSGELDWEYQRLEAENAVRPLIGVVGVSNAITLKPCATPDRLSNLIHEALRRHAAREANHIDISVDGSTVTLRGSVGSWSERAAVAGAAWSAPGVAQVVNRIELQG